MSDQDKLDISIFIKYYLDDCREGFQAINDALLALEKDQGQIEKLDEIYRRFHPLKSSSVMLEFEDVAELTHAGEDLLDYLRKMCRQLHERISRYFLKSPINLK
jgi:two-component system chemotaxis sensor kinase CheA